MDTIHVQAAAAAAPQPEPVDESFWDIIDEQIDYLLDLSHPQECVCRPCNRRDRLIALLMEPMA